MTSGFGVVAADDDTIGAHEILERRALLEELGVRDHGERVLGFFRDDVGNTLRGADGHGGFVDDDLAVVHRAADLCGDGFDRAEIRAAILARRRADGDEDDLRTAHRVLEIGREFEAPGLVVFRDDVAEARLVDRDPALDQGLNLLLVLIYAGDVVARFSEARPRHETDVTGSNHCDAHLTPPGTPPRRPTHIGRSSASGRAT